MRMQIEVPKSIGNADLGANLVKNVYSQNVQGN